MKGSSEGGSYFRRERCRRDCSPYATPETRTIAAAAASSRPDNAESIHTMMADAAIGTNGPPGARNGGLPAVTFRLRSGSRPRQQIKYATAVPEAEATTSGRNDPVSATMAHIPAYVPIAIAGVLHLGWIADSARGS